jgi:hypothetical protein
MFPPVEEETVTECPGGVCPVPWADQLVSGTKSVEAWDAYVAKHREVTSKIYDKKPELTEDTVNHPSHYTDGGIECIDAIQAALTDEEYLGYLKGNIIKYVWRERMKGRKESLDKAGWYLEKASQQREAIDS